MGAQAEVSQRLNEMLGAGWRWAPENLPHPRPLLLPRPRPLPLPRPRPALPLGTHRNSYR